MRLTLSQTIYFPIWAAHAPSISVFFFCPKSRHGGDIQNMLFVVVVVFLFKVPQPTFHYPNTFWKYKIREDDCWWRIWRMALAPISFIGDKDGQRGWPRVACWACMHRQKGNIDLLRKKAKLLGNMAIMAMAQHEIEEITYDGWEKEEEEE